MKITNDVNNNSGFLSVSNEGNENDSLLGSLFSINFNNNEVKSNNISDNFEFTFKQEDIEIIEYISNYFPNLKISNLDAPDFKRIKSEILSDKSIKTEMKDKITSLLELTKNFNKNFFIKLPKYNELKSLNNKNIVDYKGNPKDISESSKSLISFINNKKQIIDKSKETSLKSNIINKNTNEAIKSEHELDNQARLYSNNKKINFVKIKKNNHPNKIYQSLKSNSFSFKEKIDSNLLIDSKLSNNTTLNYINNQTSSDLKKNKINEIKINDKAYNISNSNDTSSKGNQFSHQNNTSFTNGGVNSILEGLLDTLDLSQKGWTSKLVSRIENALENGGEEIEFNLKPKNLGRLKVSIGLKNGTGSVKIITENTFVTNALTQNENHLQKLFNDQGINLEFSAYDDTKYSGSKNNFNKNENNNKKNNFQNSDNEQEQTNNITGLDDDVSSRHIVNVIA